MTIFGKFIFIFLVCFVYTTGFLVARTNSVRALEKILILCLSGTLFFSIIFSEYVWVFLSKILGVERGTDAVLYLFIIEAVIIARCLPAQLLCNWLAFLFKRNKLSDAFLLRGL